MSRRWLWGLFAINVASTPAAMGGMWVIAKAVYPPGMREAIHALAPATTALAWMLAPVAAALAVIAFLAQPALFRGALGKTGKTSPDGARMHAMVVSTSIVQVPAIAAAVVSSLGAAQQACWTVVAVATVGVLSQAFGIRRLPQQVVMSTTLVAK